MNTAASVTPQDLWSIAVRNKWMIAGIFVSCVTIAGILCIFLPKTFRSNTLIMVEHQKIPQDIVKTIVEAGMEERLIMIQQQVMSRTLLGSVIEEFHLYRDELRRESLESVIDSMRRQVKVETVGITGKSVEAFSISFAHENAVTAMQVTSKLASNFIGENLRVREQLVEGTSEFLEQELTNAKNRLETQEQEISAFKKKFMGELPEQMEANLRALDRYQNDRNAIREALHNLTDRQVVIDKEIKEYEATGIPGNTNPNLGGGQGRIDHLAARVKELERNLVALQSEYKETYPDILLTKQEIAKLKEKLDKNEELEQEANVATAKATAPRTTPKKHSDPYLRDLVGQQNSIRFEIASLTERQQRVMEQMRIYEGRVERTPAREQELMILLRDYGNLKDNYRTLLDKKLNARVAENLEKRQKGEQFRVIDPANIPEKPEKPNQIRIMLMGIMIGCGLGFGAAFFFEQLQPVFQRSEDVENLLGLPLLASIPLFHSAFDKSTTTLFPRLAGLPSPDRGGSLRTPLLLGQGANGKELNSASTRQSWWYRWGKPNRRSGHVQEVPADLNLVSKWRPHSVVTEQFRVAATRLTLMQANRNSIVTVITSAVKGEGKSAVAANLGYVLARDLGKSTLIIDGDLKCPMVHTYLGLKEGPGVREILDAEQSWESCLQRMEDVPLWVLTSGSVSEQAVELSKIHHLKKTLEELRTRFEYIILDAPPILPLADMHVFAGMADVVTLIIKAGVTRQTVISKALHTIRLASEPSIILNGIQSNATPYYMQEGYDYFVKKERIVKQHKAQITQV